MKEYWKWVSAVTMFMAFVLLFTMVFQPEKQMDPQFKEEPAIAMRAEPAPVAEDAEIPPGKAAVEKEEAGFLGFSLNTLALVLLMSMGATMLSWTVVERVIRKKRDVILVSFDDAKGEKIMQALTNNTCKKILGALSGNSMTESRLADKLGVSIQRVHYNLKLLLDAGLVESKKFKYSQKGKEMDIYAPTNRYFIIGPPEKGEEKEKKEAEK